MIFDADSYTNLYYYVLGYGFSIITLITLSLLVNNEEDEISALKGIGRKNPIIGIAAVVALLSLAGVPPLAGFFGKYMVFSSAFGSYPVMVIVAIITSGIGMVYYLKLLMTVVSSETENTAKISPSILQYVVLVLCTAALLIGGIVNY
jgi:NADH-quinone oxidoreductase subunit N